MTEAERDARLSILLTPGAGQGLLRAGVDAFGSAEAMLAAPGSQWASSIPRLSTQRATKLKRAVEEAVADGAVRREVDAADAAGVRFVGLNESGYPKLLSLIPDPPVLLWVRGEFAEQDALSLAIVGARKCSHYGREQAERFGYGCAEAGLTIVSGGAYGVDIAAHRGALKAKGRTLAVIGSGLADPYPHDHADLFARIADGAGALVSELPMSTPPRPENFLPRNRIISGLALGVLVVEAGRRSGALNTARRCNEEHGRELMALPGRVDSRSSEGPHQIIREGWGTLVTNVADVLDGLGEAGQTLKLGLAWSPGGEPQGESRGEKRVGSGETARSGGSGGARGLSESQRQIVKVLDAPRSLDQVTAHTGLAVSQVQADLTLLEVRGAVRRRGGLFVRKDEAVVGAGGTAR